MEYYITICYHASACYVRSTAYISMGSAGITLQPIFDSQVTMFYNAKNLVRAWLFELQRDKCLIDESECRAINQHREPSAFKRLHTLLFRMLLTSKKEFFGPNLFERRPLYVKSLLFDEAATLMYQVPRLVPSADICVVDLAAVEKVQHCRKPVQ